MRSDRNRRLPGEADHRSGRPLGFREEETVHREIDRSAGASSALSSRGYFRAADIRTPMTRASCTANSASISKHCFCVEKWVLPPRRVTSSHAATIRHRSVAPKPRDLRVNRYAAEELPPGENGAGHYARPMQKHMLEMDAEFAVQEARVMGVRCRQARKLPREDRQRKLQPTVYFTIELSPPHESRGGRPRTVIASPGRRSIPIERIAGPFRSSGPAASDAPSFSRYDVAPGAAWPTTTHARSYLSSAPPTTCS